MPVLHTAPSDDSPNPSPPVRWCGSSYWICTHAQTALADADELTRAGPNVSSILRADRLHNFFVHVPLAARASNTAAIAVILISARRTFLLECWLWWAIS